MSSLWGSHLERGPHHAIYLHQLSSQVLRFQGTYWCPFDLRHNHRWLQKNITEIEMLHSPSCCSERELLSSETPAREQLGPYTVKGLTQARVFPRLVEALGQTKLAQREGSWNSTGDCLHGTLTQFCAHLLWCVRCKLLGKVTGWEDEGFPHMTLIQTNYEPPKHSSQKGKVLPETYFYPCTKTCCLPAAPLYLHGLKHFSLETENTDFWQFFKE